MANRATKWSHTAKCHTLVTTIYPTAEFPSCVGTAHKDVILSHFIQKLLCGHKLLVSTNLFVTLPLNYGKALGFIVLLLVFKFLNDKVTKTHARCKKHHAVVKVNHPSIFYSLIFINTHSSFIRDFSFFFPLQFECGVLGEPFACQRYRTQSFLLCTATYIYLLEVKIS